MLEIIKAIFDGVWGMFSIKYPGFDFSIGTVLLGALCAVLGLKVLGMILGFSFSPGHILSHVRGGNNKSIKVDEKRRGDTV